MKRILFVCTGNTCRSPMAEGMLRLMAERAGIPVDVSSAGVSAMNGSPISVHSQSILRGMGYKHASASNALSADLVEWADIILTMTESHKHSLARRYPEAADKTYTLIEFTEDDPRVLEAMAERERLVSDLEVKRALSQVIMPEEEKRVYELDGAIPSFDIADPFGGTEREYRDCAAQIERHVAKLLNRLRS